MGYVDGVILAVPVSQREAYQVAAVAIAALFVECGATDVVDCWGDDVPEGVLTSFTMAVKRQEDEAVVFSWIRWPSRAVRDEGWKKVMADPRMAAMPERLFDGKRMIFGGFDVIQSTSTGA